MHINKIRLKDFLELEFMEKALSIYGLTPINDFPLLARELKKYRNRIMLLPKLSGILNFGETVFEKVNIDQNNFYEVAWNIPVTRKVIMKYRPPLQEFNLDELIDLVEKKFINQSHLSFALKNSSPIILASYPPLVTNKKTVILDGNHRITSKHLDGQKKISGYVLEPQLHIKSMVSEVDRTLYKIHANYYRIALYIGGLITLKDLLESLYPL